MMKLRDHPLYPVIKQYKKEHGRILMRKYGAHALGISWIEDEHSNRQPALTFYIDPDIVVDHSIPEAFQSSDIHGMRWDIPSRVVHTPPAKFEEQS